MHEQMKRLYEAAKRQKGLEGKSAVANLLNMSPQALNNWEARGMSKDGIFAASEILNISAIWLAEGKGSPDYEQSVDSLIDNNLSFRPVTIAEPNDSEWVEVRKVQLRLAAGISGFSIDHDADDGQSLPFRRSWVEKNGFVPAKLVAIKVKGESMEPSLYDGDTVVINTADIKPKDGEVFAVNYEGEAVVKRMVRDLGQWYLASDNADRKYARKACQDKTCIIIGKVVHKQSDRI